VYCTSERMSREQNGPSCPSALMRRRISTRWLGRASCRLVQHQQIGLWQDGSGEADLLVSLDNSPIDAEHLVNSRRDGGPLRAGTGPRSRAADERQVSATSMSPSGLFSGRYPTRRFASHPASESGCRRT
jgi:hypothetical protein